MKDTKFYYEDKNSIETAARKITKTFQYIRAFRIDIHGATLSQKTAAKNCYYNN